MLGKMLSGLLIAIGVVGLSHGQAPKGDSRSSAAPTIISDPNWRPAAGDRVTVRLPDSPALLDRESCERYIKFSRAGDSAGIDELTSKPGVGKLAVGTPILVVTPHGLPRPDTSSYSGLSADQVQSAMQDSIMRSAGRPKPVVSIEARILDGPMKDALRFIPMESLASIVAGPAAPTLHAGDRAIVAATSIPMGRDEELFSQYLSNPSEPSNRPYSVSLNKGAKVTILDVNRRFYHIKVNSNSKFAGRVGYVEFEGLRLVESPPTNTKQGK
jgi:hypothetical protein